MINQDLPVSGVVRTINIRAVALAANAGATVIHSVKIGLGRVYRAVLEGSAHDAVAGHSAFYRVEAVIKNIAGTTALVGSAVASATFEDDSSWALTLAANNTDDTLEVTATPDASNITSFKGKLALYDLGVIVK